jgi:glycolate oxidase FAD binding subunit
MTDDAKGLIEALKHAGGAETVGDDVAGHYVDGTRPRAVAYPTDIEMLSRVLKAAHDQDAAVAPWGGGTRTDLGNAPERLDAVIDLSGLNRVVDHDPADLTATVQAGITLAKLQETLGRHGQFLALDPPLPDRATIGGTLASGVSGPLKWQYTSPRDLVIGMKVVSPDGTVTKSGGQVVKNVSGYDMSRLHIGGLGTLGIIAEVSLKLTPLPTGQATVVAAFDTSRACLKAVLDIFRSDVMPLALTTFGRVANGLMHATDLGGMAFLAVRLGGRALALERQVRECRTVCRHHGSARIEVLDEPGATSLWRSLADFSWDDQTEPAVAGRAHLMPSKVPELVEMVEHSRYFKSMRPGIVSHPAHGTALLSWFDGDNGPSPEEAVTTLRHALDMVHQLGGKMVIERCPPAVKSSFDVWDDVGEPLAIMRNLKEQYDPRRILNPGRFVGGI